MKNTFAFVALTMFNFAIGQTLQQKLESGICKCFNEQEFIFNKSKDLDVLDKCFDLPFRDLEKEFEEEIAKKIDTTAANSYELGLDYGRKLFNDMQDGLIINCDSYYNVMQNISKLMYENMGKGVNQQKIDSISLLVKNDLSNDMLLWERGAYNLGLKKIDEAQEDFSNCITINPKNHIATFCLGWTYDLQGNNKKAVEYYEQSINSTEDLGYFREIGRINLAIIRRKIREK